MTIQPTVSMLGIPMHPWTMERTVAEISSRMDEGIFTQHVVVNVAKMVNMRKDAVLREAVLDCDIINIDGMGVVWGARLFGLEVPERVTGVDLFVNLLSMASERGYSVYLLGATEEVIGIVEKKVRSQFPDLKLAGCHHGYFWEEEEDIVRDISESGSDMLFVAITSPKKEQFIQKWKDRLGVRFAMGVGGSFDILAGKTKRAPKWMQRNGLEWLYRIIQEPSRMWKRYMITNLAYFWLLIRGLLSKRFREKG